ncbi:hypothetical protein [Halobaculum roseum]|uniref:SPW repeat-containing protein n=1 Tax=Halobaculum roseum TaxID=2175149 RepID=A0ABD5MWN7_9EURY|nr:hypothetical protein [Halobaculum roseum]QZY02037.1 hypothetical protein K6T36_12060 [Halobaculum roseum]
MTRSPRSLIAQFALWTAGAVGVQLVLGVSWGSPASALDPPALADAALVGTCVAAGALAASPLSVYGRDIVGVLVGIALLTLLSTAAFGADASTVNEVVSLAGGYGVFVALAYTVGWALDGVVRRGVVVEDGAATFAGDR